MDELALMCLARLWHRHFVIVMKDFIWTTGVSITLDDCTIILAYVGNLTFIDTIDVDEVNAVLAKQQYASPLYTTPPHLKLML